MQPIEHLYFHIPFCPKLCPYCCFYVEEGSKNKNKAFLDALLKEVDQAAGLYSLQPKTIYFGGGTPTALLTDQLDYLLTELKKRISIEHIEEWTMEANPATVRAEKAQLLVHHGVSRISLGVQSWNSSSLKTLGRVHSRDQALKTVSILREAGVCELNIDLMFSVPGQTLQEWESDLDTTIQLAPNHISAYCLTYEEDTDFFKKLTGGTFTQNEEHDAQLFELTMDRLASAGYRHYEISNHARPGAESKHNQAYWEGKHFLGFGPSAFSTLPGVRLQNVCDTARYIQHLNEGTDPVVSKEVLTEQTRLKEKIAFGLRMDSGAETAILTPWHEAMSPLFELQLLEQIGEKIRLTRKGKLLADSVAETFI